METFIDDGIGDGATPFPITKHDGESLAVTLPETFFRRCVEIAAEVERKANEIVVADSDSAQVAAAFVGKIKLTQKRADALLGEPKAALNDARAKIIDAEKAIAAKLDAATRSANGKIMRWQEQERRKAEAEAARIRAEHEAAERKRREAFEAEQARVRAEQEAERKRIEEEALAEAARLEAEGNKAEAEAVLAMAAEDAEAVEQPAEVFHEEPPPSLNIAPPKVACIHERKGPWKGELVDIMAVVKFVAANPAHVGILSINQTALNALARATQGNLKIPGIRFAQEAGTVVNRALRTV